MFSTRRVGALETQVERLKNQIQALENQWKAERLTLAELYDKTYHMLKRHEKRLRDATKDREVEPQADPSPEMDLVSQRILARRNRRHGVSG